MKVVSIKTEKVVPSGISLFDLLDKYVENLEEGSILAVTSKVIAICEGRVVAVEGANKDEIIKEEADLFLPKDSNKYNLYLTIKENILAVSAGVDESNADGYYVLWPKNSQDTANKIREYLTQKFNIKNLGIIITDSKTTPLRWGVIGISVAHSGFLALNDLIGTPDIFGRNLKMTKVSIMDGLAVSAALVMGEGNEQTPLAVITDVPFVKFQDRNPTDQEISELKIALDDDVYAPVLKLAPWTSNKKK